MSRNNTGKVDGWETVCNHGEEELGLLWDWWADFINCVLSVELRVVKENLPLGPFLDVRALRGLETGKGVSLCHSDPCAQSPFLQGIPNSSAIVFRLVPQP